MLTFISVLRERENDLLGGAVQAFQRTSFGKYIQHIGDSIYSHQASSKTNAVVFNFTTTLMWPLCHIFTMAIIAL
jgi:hypothetical protein